MSGQHRLGSFLLAATLLASPVWVVARADGDILYDQRGSCTDHAANSQLYDSFFDTYTDIAADDFVVPAGATWNVGLVDVGGVYYNGPGPAPAVNVVFYQDGSGEPGTPVCTYSGLTTFADAAGAFSITLPSACTLTAPTDATYWVSVQAQLDYLGSMSQWGWYGNTPQVGHPAKWQNPGGAFGACPTWGDAGVCVFAAGPDFCFALASGPTNDTIFANGFDGSTP